MTHKINGRPVMSLSAAAQQTGVSYLTAWRYVTTEWWHGVQVDGKWFVFADQPLTVKVGRPNRRKS